jgi:hypothetical protein
MKEIDSAPVPATATATELARSTLAFSEPLHSPYARLDAFDENLRRGAMRTPVESRAGKQGKSRSTRGEGGD